MKNLVREFDIKELISAQAIQEKVKDLGKQITTYYQEHKEPLVLLGVLKGSIIFLADLCRTIDLPLELELMGVSSYGEATKSSGVVRITQDLARPIKDKNVLIVEDIFDSGLTVKYLYENLKAREPKSIKVCTLLKKNTPRQVDMKLDFVGFTIPDEFVVGYGLDLSERLRNLPLIGIYKPQ